MPIIAKSVAEKVYPNIEELGLLEKHSKHSNFHEDLLAFWIKYGFLTDKQIKYINRCNFCGTFQRRYGYYEYDIGRL